MKIKLTNKISKEELRLEVKFVRIFKPEGYNATSLSFDSEELTMSIRKNLQLFLEDEEAHSIINDVPENRTFCVIINDEEFDVNID